MNVHLHLPHPHLHDVHVPRHMHPLVLAGIAIVSWLVLVAVSSLLWSTGFGFDGRESLALSAGLLTYIVATVAVMGIIAYACAHDHR